MIIGISGLIVFVTMLKCTLAVPTDPIVLAELKALKLG